jgi:hypothetical protein
MYMEILRNSEKGAKDATVDVTPLSHPINVNVSGYFKEGQKDISALYSPFRIE